MKRKIKLIMNNTSDAGEWYQNFSHICYAAPEADTAKSVCGPKDVCSQKGRNSFENDDNF